MACINFGPNVSSLRGALQIILNESKINGHLSVLDSGYGTTPRLMLIDAAVRGSIFLARVSVKGLCLRQAKVSGSLDLRNTTVTDEVDLTQVVIEGDVRLDGAVINNNLVATKARVRGDVFCSGARIVGAFDLWGTRIEETVYFDNAMLCGPIRFELCSAHQVWLGENRPSLFGRSRCGIGGLRDKRTGFSFWRFVRLTLERGCDWERADRARYFERVWKWKSGWWRSDVNAGFSLLRFPFYLIGYIAELVFLRLATAYGVSLYRLFLSWGFVVGGFATAYYLLTRYCVNCVFDVLSPGLESWPLSFGRALYFSVITFTTLGYGDIRPGAGLGSILTALEAVLGAIMIALTVLVLGRKFLR